MLTSVCSGVETALSDVRKLFKKKEKTRIKSQRIVAGLILDRTTVMKNVSGFFFCRKCFIQEAIKMFHKHIE